MQMNLHTSNSTGGRGLGGFRKSSGWTSEQMEVTMVGRVEFPGPFWQLSPGFWPSEDRELRVQGPIQSHTKPFTSGALGLQVF